MGLQVFSDACVDLLAAHRIVEQRGADTHGARARDDELDGVGSRRDAALADDGYVVFASHVIHLMNFQQRDRLDRGAREPALNVTDDRSARFRVDGHAHDGVDDRQTIASGFDTKPRVFFDIGLVG